MKHQLFRHFHQLALTLLAGITTLASADEFSRWTWRVPSPPSIHFRHVVFAEGQFVAVGFEGAIITSTNGTNWFLEETVTTNVLQRIIYGERYVASGNYGTVVASQDGKLWQLGNFPNSQLLLAVAYGSDTYVALDAAGNFAHSADALAWALVEPPAPHGGLDLIFGGGQFVAVGGFGMILTSADGLNWVERESGTTGGIQSIAYGDGRYVAVGAEGGGVGTGFILSSTDAITWFLQTVETPLKDVTYADGQFVILGGDLGPGSTLTSDDGTYFSGAPPGDSGLGSDVRGVACGNGVCVAVGNGVYTSDDGGLTWTSANSGPLTTIYSFAKHDNTVVGVGRDGAILTTTNGVDFIDQRLGPESPWFTWFEVCHGDSGFVAVGDAGQVAHSVDGLTWSVKAVTAGTIYAVASSGSNFVGVASEASGKPYGYFVLSENGVDWEERRPFANRYINASITYGAGQYIAAGGGGTNYVSPNGFQWLLRPMGVPYTAQPIKYLNGRFIGASQGGMVLSNDGLTWELHAVECPNMSDLTYGNGVYLATAIFPPVLWSSPDGLNWQPEKIGVSDLRSAIYAYDSFFVGAVVIQSRSSLIPNLERVFLENSQLNAEVFGRIGRDYELQSSRNLTDWDHEQDYTQSARQHPLILPTGPDQRFYRVKLKEP